MGNIPPSVKTVSTLYQTSHGLISVSTRSEPIAGYVVTKECGLVFATSSSYTSPAEHDVKVQEAMGLLSNQAGALGANAVLALNMEVKDLHGNGKHHMAQVQMYGTAVVVAGK